MNSRFDMPDESISRAEILHASTAMSEVSRKEGSNMLDFVYFCNVGSEPLKRPTRKGALRAFESKRHFLLNAQARVVCPRR